MEAKTGDHATINNLIDAHEAQSEEQTWIKDKLAGTVDRSHHNNVKISGVSKAVQDLSAYVRGPLKTLSLIAYIGSPCLDTCQTRYPEKSSFAPHFIMLRINSCKKQDPPIPYLNRMLSFNFMLPIYSA